MANLQKIVVVLLIVTLVLSVASVVFNIAIFKMKPSEIPAVRSTTSSNSGNIGFVVEGNSVGGANG